jgi:hypothetical protein
VHFRTLVGRVVVEAGFRLHVKSGVVKRISASQWQCFVPSLSFSVHKKDSLSGSNYPNPVSTMQQTP